MELIVKILSATERIALLDWIIENNLTAKKAWPFLYDGDPIYTRKVIESYVHDDRCLVTAVFGDGRPVAVAMENAVSALPGGFFQLESWVKSMGSSLEKTYWSNWMIVDPELRGVNLGAQIMTATIAELKSRGAELWVFDVLNRRLPDPRAPEGYRNDASYYEKHGFKRAMVPPVFSSWVDIGDDKPSKKFYFTYYMDLRQ
jgi:GNAT superfamily N-acetyltransferase